MMHNFFTISYEYICIQLYTFNSVKAFKISFSTNLFSQGPAFCPQYLPTFQWRYPRVQRQVVGRRLPPSLLPADALPPTDFKQHKNISIVFKPIQST